MLNNFPQISLPKVILAPMAGVADRPFRIMCRRYGCELAVSEMISSQALRFGDLKTARFAEISPGDSPLAIQIFGHDPHWMANAARLLSSGGVNGCPMFAPPFSIDINMGCPVKKIVSNGDGSALMKNPRLCGEIISSCTEALRESAIPLTVKIRAGWDFDSLNAPLIAQIAEQSGASAITVHGRTRSQMYSPSSSLSVIRDVVKSVSIPVIGNGDIYSAEDALRMFYETSCHSVMVARGAMGNPFIFEEIRCALNGIPYSRPEPEQRISAALEHLNLAAAEIGEDSRIHHMRAPLGWYVKNFRDAANVRSKINSADTAAQMREILSSAVKLK